ncbi:hypothetical protein [Devosia sp. LjRoot3]|uniref:hypothetical protein n=1 Tax=Devosia sp. LjRoot3 TaxID=3342319 RepID=UPI003ED09E96
MILLVSNSRDITTDFIVAELRRRGVPFHRFNGDLADRAGLIFSVSEEGNASWSLMVEGHRVQATFRSAYFRRPALPDLGSELDVRFVDQVNGEWAALLNSFYSSLDCRWLSDPSLIAKAEDKPRQLALAASMGFSIPTATITNEFAQASAFVSSGPAVAKPLRSGRLSRGAEEQIAFTSLLDGISALDEASIRVSPVIYQRAVKKARDLRITVVGARVFACEITQIDATEIDWRRLGTEQLSYRAVDLPPPLADLCINLVNALGLGFGAIDLVQDWEDRYWFLEINPNGQWAWIERQAGLPIAAAIVDVLTGEAD